MTRDVIRPANEVEEDLPDAMIDSRVASGCRTCAKKEGAAEKDCEEACRGLRMDDARVCRFAPRSGTARSF